MIYKVKMYFNSDKCLIFKVGDTGMKIVEDQLCYNNGKFICIKDVDGRGGFFDVETIAYITYYKCGEEKK